MGFPIVLHKDGAFVHHIEVGPFPSNFVFPYVPVPFLMADEHLRHSRELVDVFKNDIVDFTCFEFQAQVDSAYPLDIDDTTNSIDFYIFHLL